MLYELTLTLGAGQDKVGHPLLFGANPIRVTREGVGYNRINNAELFTDNKMYSFRNSGLFVAYKIVFPIVGGPGGEKVHVIYTI